MKLLKTTGYLAAVAAIVFTLGCSEDANTAGPGNTTTPPAVDGVWASPDTASLSAIPATETTPAIPAHKNIGELIVKLNVDKSFSLEKKATILIGNFIPDVNNKDDTVVEPQLSTILASLNAVKPIITNPTKLATGTWRSSATHLFYKMAGSAVEDSSAYTLNGAILTTIMKTPTPKSYTFTKK